ncbi:MAG: ribosomal RNA small subunit methyltransferase A [Elusimicrobia bacterium]|nr:ribosomal RNA small subunit methyltransferase A [Elusimicrobiota bacterium]
MGARLDQHYLVDTAVRDAIAAAADIGPADSVLEIGPGRGILTSALVGRAGAVVAVELDELLAAQLSAALGSPGNLRVVNADFLEFDLEPLGPGPWKIAANLPYAVGTPILQRLLPWPRWSTAVLMFQKEVAERIAARPGGADYGLLTLSVMVHAEAELLLEVSRESFRPRPKVASSVVVVRRRPQPLVPAAEQAGFFRVAKAAFGQRRKMALGVLSRSLGLERARLEGAFAELGIAPSARAEEIPFDLWRALAKNLGTPY